MVFVLQIFYTKHPPENTKKNMNGKQGGKYILCLIFVDAES